ncbi:MAG: alpha-amylase family glycosyl hydrolase [Kiritimatiellae bacterium]|nr:alpha-amylase family glycosyl hydrolase [Kiritimatiellia bacterium]MDW8458195.1 alpha-amylase family glycosyl hydrolase [Verrucomicrobiota bacterium]
MFVYLFVLMGAIAWVGEVMADSVRIVHSPPNPSIHDPITIEIHGAKQGAILHWGVNAVGTLWEEAIPAHRPPGSEQHGVATRTRMSGPDEKGVLRAVLGPFNNTGQLVRALNFAIHWDDGSWSNKDEKNFNIPVSFGRIAVDPLEPTINDRIIVKVFRSKPGGFLRWGVNAENDMWQPPIRAYWPSGSFPTRDGLALDTPLSRPDSNGVSIAVLGPFNRPEQVIHTLHMAAHWGDEWDTDAGRNYNIAISFEVGADDPEVKIIAPEPDQVVVEAPEVALRAKRADRVELRLNGNVIASSTRTPLELKIPFETLEFGRHLLTASAERAGRVSLHEIAFWKLPPHRIEPIPPGTPWGATIHGDGTATFALHAPGKRFVSLVGDFNGWDLFADMMNYSPDGTWWVRRPISNGVWRYQYAIEGRRLLADPYAREIVWTNAAGQKCYQPWNARAVLRVGDEAFVWTVTNRIRPPLDQLAIYELHLMDMQPGGGFTGLISRLDYIRDLGFNALKIMPWTAVPGTDSWGYNPAFHFAVEPTYGSPRDLKRLIDEAHRRGIAVIQDAVYNHMDRSSPLFQLYGHDYAASPYFREYRGENWGFPDIDQRSRAVRRYMQDAIAFWLREYRIDGIRFDATRFVEWEGYNDWGAGWFAYVGRKTDPDAWMIAEHMPSDPALVNQTEMDTTWGDYFMWNLRRMVLDATLDRAAFADLMVPMRIGFTSALQRIAYVESHDEERIMRGLLARGYSRSEARRRAELAYAMMVLAPGPMMAYAGQEHGEDTPKIVGPNPIRWDRTRGIFAGENRQLFRAVRELTRLRTTHPALRGEWVSIHEGLPEGIAAVDRTGAGGSVLAVGNFSRAPQSALIRLPVPGPWRPVLEGREWTLRENGLVVRLQPGEVAVFATGSEELASR